MKDVSPSQKTFSLHGIPEHLLAGVDPSLTSVRVGDGRGLPLCGQRKGLVRRRLLVGGGHHVGGVGVVAVGRDGHKDGRPAHRAVRPGHMVSL